MKPTLPDEEPGRQTPEDLLPRRSAQRKTGLVLQLLRGEPVHAVSRQSRVPVHELESWKRVFVGAGACELKSRTNELELMRARAKIAELMMRLALAEHLIEKRGFAEEWRRLKHRRQGARA